MENSHRAASGRRRHLRAPETRSEPEDGTTRLRGMAPVRPRRTSPGSPDAYRRCSARHYPHLVRGAPSKRTAAAARPRPCEGSIGRRDLRRDFDKTKPSASIHAPPTPHTTHLTQPPDSTRSGSGYEAQASMQWPHTASEPPRARRRRGHLYPVLLRASALLRCGHLRASHERPGQPHGQ